MGVLLAVCLLLVMQTSDAASFPRPHHSEHAKLARWLVHSIDWGSLSTVAEDGTPSVGVVSFSDGANDDPSGRLFFYLTPMDETTKHLQNNPNCALSISEAQLGAQTCKDTDPEDPTCARISIFGKMHEVTHSGDRDRAAQALFSRHPVMRDWPADHAFLFFELQVEEIHMLSWYGGMYTIPAEEYQAADLDVSQVISRSS